MARGRAASPTKARAFWLSSVVFCALATAAVSPRAAFAGPPEAQAELSKEGARALADHGYELFKAGKYEEALAAFDEAERRYHAPTILLMMARSSERLGLLLKARGVYERVLAEALPAGAPRAFKDAQSAAKEELAALAPRIPMLEVVLTGEQPSDLEVTVDGDPVVPEAGPVPRDPGRAIVVAQAPGHPRIERVVTLKEGQTERVTLNLTGMSPPAPAGPARERGLLLPAGIALGTAGVGLGIGVVTGVIAAVQIDDIKSRCAPGGHCPVADKENADEAQTLITVSTLGFVTAAVGAAAGVTLLVVRRPAGEEGPAVSVLAGPGSAHLVGRF